jgi:hypothetical protein
MSIYTRVLKDEKADVFKKYSTSDGIGGDAFVYKPISPGALWCYTRIQDARIEDIAEARNYIEQREFTFNYNENINVFDLVRYKNTWFEIIEVVNEYASETAIVARALGSISPKDSEILPYENS